MNVLQVLSDAENSSMASTFSYAVDDCCNYIP